MLVPAADFMRLACVDKTSADRLQLEKRLDDAFSAHRGVVGHLPHPTFTRAPIDELLFAARPETVVIGPGFGIEESFSACRQVREKFEGVPLVVIFSPENFSLRVLRRFERFTKALFTTDEPSVRLIHILFELGGESARPRKGALITVSGVKGGVGATSYVAGLAHAAESLGFTCVLIDLSPSGALLHYLGTPRAQSPEYTTLLTDLIRPERDLLDRLIAKAPNGISALLPPAGGRDVRELWLRDAKRLELSLGLIELLMEMFDLVLVDLAGSEGILPFGVLSQSDIRVLIGSNEPAAVFLLHRGVGELAQIPGDGTVAVALSQLLPTGLTAADVFDFVLTEFPADQAFLRLPQVPLDDRARHWVGTGNTLYTEGSKALQEALETHIRMLAAATGRFEKLSGGPHSAETKATRGGLPLRMRRLLRSFCRRGAVPPSGPAPLMKLLPCAPRASSEQSSAEPFEASARLVAKNVEADFRPELAAVLRPKAPCAPLAPGPETGLDEHDDSRGSLTLEYALFAGAAAVIAASAVPGFFQGLVLYLQRFTEGGKL